MKSVIINLARWTAADIKELYAAVKSNSLDFKDLDRNRIKVFGEEDNLMNFLDIFFDEDDDVYEKIQNLKESNVSKFQKYLKEAQTNNDLLDRAYKWKDDYQNSEGGRGHDPKDEEMLADADEIIALLCKALGA